METSPGVLPAKDSSPVHHKATRSNTFSHIRPFRVPNQACCFFGLWKEARMPWKRLHATLYTFYFYQSYIKHEFKAQLYLFCVISFIFEEPKTQVCTTMWQHCTAAPLRLLIKGLIVFFKYQWPSVPHLFLWETPCSNLLHRIFLLASSF